jgi:type II secretory pathway component PulM
MRKFKPLKYNTGEGLVKIRMEDDTGAQIESYSIMFSDLALWFELMKHKYGMKTFTKEDKDLDWLK